MSTSSKQVTRAAGTAAVNLVPLVIVAIVVYAIWRVFKGEAQDFLGAAGEFAGAQQTGELTETGPTTAGTLEFLSGAIDEPPNNGRAARGLFRSTYPVKFRVNNPKGPRDARVILKATEYSHWPYENKVSTWSDVLKLKTGNNHFTVSMPITAGGFKLDVNLILEVDGELIASTLYVIE